MVKKLIFILMSSILLGVLFFSNISAVITQEYCCEKTSEGAICQSSTQCAVGSAKQMTSCDQTTFCKLGTCVDPTEGRCLPNTPQGVCNEGGGFWSQASIEDLPQCNQGCCFYGGQSVFTTQTRCNTLAGFFGFEAVYNGAITDEFTCYASANTEVEGACVFEKNGQTTCKRLTQGVCNELKRSSANGEVKFNEGYLCSADFLGGICGASQKTTCVEGSAEVYFLDTCGNIANIYDSSQWPLDRATNAEYWNKIIDKQDSCGYDNAKGNANSPSCGNCEYLLGSICGKAVNGETANPNLGNNVCKDLSCEYKGQTYAHGEKWCTTGEVVNAASRTTESSTEMPSRRTILSSFLQKSNLRTTASQEINVWSDYLPGTESFVMKCYNGQVLEEPCSQGEYRNKICMESEVEGISNAGCVLNIWMSCVNQKTEEDCLDSDLDCEWVEGYAIQKNEEGVALAEDANGNSIQASCVPKSSPAFDFWNVENANVDQICDLVQDVCKVEYEFPVLKNRKDVDGNDMDDKLERAKYCSKNCQCLEGYEEGMSKINKRERFEKDHKDEPWLLNYEDWKSARNNVCFSLGDCGYKNNAFGLSGYYAEKDLISAEFFRKAKDFREEYE